MNIASANETIIYFILASLYLTQKGTGALTEVSA